MSAKQPAEANKENFKERMLKEISAKISTAVPELKESLGEKKFDKRIKRAAELLSKGIKPVAPKKLSPGKKSAPAKKAKAAALPKKAGKVSSAK